MAHVQQIDSDGNGQRELGHPNHTDLADGKLKSVLLIYAINVHTKRHAPSKNGPEDPLSEAVPPPTRIDNYGPTTVVEKGQPTKVWITAESMGQKIQH